MTPRRRRRSLALAVAPLVLLLAACAEDAPLDTLEPRGPQARTIDDLVAPVFLVAGVVFLFVQLGVLFLAWRFRQRRADDDALPDQVHGNTRLEIGWTVIPAVILVFVSVGTVATIIDLADEPEGATEVTVVGQQWWWEFRYDVDDDGTDDIVTANDLVVPAGEPVNLDITARDVIHSFWIPSLNGKLDAVPGRSHPLTIESDEPGVFRGQCTEFCGLSHAYMQMRVVALEPAEYDAWVDNQLRDATEPAAGSAAADGLEAFQTQCSSCHLVRGGNDDVFDGSAQVAGVAPDLTHLMSRGTFAGAMRDLWVDLDGNGEVDIDEVGGQLDRNALEAWLRDPGSVKPMSPPTRGMPNLNLSEEQIDALVAYLETLD